MDGNGNGNGGDEMGMRRTSCLRRALGRYVGLAYLCMEAGISMYVSVNEWRERVKTAYRVKDVALASGLDLSPCPKKSSANEALNPSPVFKAKTAFSFVMFRPSWGIRLWFARVFNCVGRVSLGLIEGSQPLRSRATRTGLWISGFYAGCKIMSSELGFPD